MNAKAIVAFLSAILFQIFSFQLPDDVQVATAALLVSLVVWLVPNKK